MENLVQKQILKKKKQTSTGIISFDKEDICYFSLLSYFYWVCKICIFQVEGWKLI